MMNLNDLYQDVIVDHNNNPRNCHALCDADISADGYNPLCGDKLKLFMKFDDDLITDASFTGCGCAISTASASLMTEFVKGKTKTAAHEMFKHFHHALTEDDATAFEQLGKLKALAGVKAFPARVKCATLAWHTLKTALTNEASVATTE